jgi:drug/metabolite transporter (DMT)-like permease
MRASMRLSPAVMLVLACALWGGATVLSKALLASIPPVTLLVLQLAPSAAMLWVAFWFSGGRRSPSALILPLVLLGLLNPGISYTMSLMGLARISASVSTLLWAAEPLMILGLAAIFLREQVTPRLLAVILAGMFGVSLVSGAWSGVQGSDSDPAGILLLLGAVLCCAFYTVFSRRLSESLDPVFIVAVQQTAGLGWAVALLVSGTSHGSPSDLAGVQSELAVAAALSGVLYYAAAYWLYIAALRWVPAAVAGSYFNVIPVFGVTFAFVFLGERLSPVQWMGAAVILVAVFELVRLTRASENPRDTS